MRLTGLEIIKMTNPEALDPQAIKPLWRDYLELCKPNVVALMILTAIVGMFLAVPGMVPLDILIIGNHYGVEVETTRYDAGFGAVFLGDGKNNFKFLPPTSSGLYISKDSRSIHPIKINKRNALLIGNNNDSLVVLKKNL